MRGLPPRAAALLVTLLVSAHARAEAPCVVRLVDHAGDGTWAQVVTNASRAIAEEDTGDCAEIVVDPGRDGAMVTFTTRDGRVARRHIQRPADLGPLVDALTVTVPMATEDEPELVATTPDATELIAPPPPPTFELGAPPAADHGVTRPERPLSLVGFATGGALTSGRSDGAAAIAQLGLGLVYRGWQLDAVGRIEAEHDVAGRKRAGQELSSVGAGVRASRRTTVGSLVLVSGISLAAQYATLEDHRTTPKLEKSWVEPRAGAFVGFVGPRVGPFRIRGELLGEIAFAARDVASGWGAGAMLGIETGFLP